MSTFRHLTLGAAALATLAATVGCGQTGMMNTYVPQMVRSGMPIINAMGVTRKLGYNLADAKHVRHNIHHLPRQAMLPSAVDNRHFCSPVADQGQLGSCTAFAMGKGLREYLENKNGEQAVPVSALFLYYEERKLEGSVDQDSGASMKDGMTVLNQTGVAADELWPYDISKFTQIPPKAAYADAPNHKIKGFQEVSGVDDAKTAIANGDPVAIGMVVYESFENIGSNGVMPMPKKGESILGGHALLLVGYNDAKKQFIVRNSWSSGWGDHGYFYMPYAFASGSIGGQADIMEWYTSNG
ncbi:MAG TPA: C1 family peptidase [Oscillatoriaceae cyanobacterium]